MTVRRYYSARKNPEQNKLDLTNLKKIVFSIWQNFSSNGYFQENFGINCTNGDIAGKIGDVSGYILRTIRKENLWPFYLKYEGYSEEDLFDMIEFFYDHISKPEDGSHHDWNGCGMHYNTFNVSIGQEDFALEINQFLNDYGDGYELSANGEILILGPKALKPILSAPIPDSGKDIKQKMEHAANKFRKYGSAILDREESVRILAHCFEYMRPEVKKVLNHKDEQDLFNILNSFNIRHSNQMQKTNYDKNIWLSWMFYFYYSSLIAFLHLLNKKQKTEKFQKV